MRWIQGLEAGQAEARAEIAAVQAESADAEGRVAVLEDKIEALEAENAHLESMKVPCFPTSEETKDCLPGDLTLEVLTSLCAATSLLRTCLTQRLLQEERACFAYMCFFCNVGECQQTVRLCQMFTFSLPLHGPWKADVMLLLMS